MNEKIMVVDDEPNVLTLMEIVLKRKGFTVVVANDAIKAITLLSKEKPDLFILDVMMPGISGLELCEVLRTRPDTARTPVLMLSARADSESVQRGLAAGANEYLQKTTSPTQVVGRVQALLESKNQYVEHII